MMPEVTSKFLLISLSHTNGADACSEPCQTSKIKLFEKESIKTYEGIRALFGKMCTRFFVLVRRALIVKILTRRLHRNKCMIFRLFYDGTSNTSSYDNQQLQHLLHSLLWRLILNKKNF